MPVDVVFEDRDKVEQLNSVLSKSGYQLIYENGHLALDSADSGYSPLIIDFTSGKARHRRLYGGGSNQPLAKAVGLKSGYKPKIFDLTAGLGRDAFVMATLRCQVTLVERSAVIACLLDHALKLALENEEVNEIVQRMHLIEADSRQFLESLQPDEKPDVIYLDPMYPHREKSALVKKEMRIFRDLVGDDADASDLLDISRQHVLKRVVVKRPKGAGYLSDQKPAFQITGKNTRYDCYLPAT